jgi:thiamine transport system substrate-binding protein
MFVFPASTAAVLPALFEEHAAIVEVPLTMEPADIDAGRERWLEEWTDVVLR